MEASARTAAASPPIVNDCTFSLDATAEEPGGGVAATRSN
jgi:hypothetical protein